MRLAVRLGGERLGFAVLGQRPSLCQVLPPLRPDRPVAEALRGALDASRIGWLLERTAEELVVVHPSHWPVARVRAALAALPPLASVVSTCPAAQAVAREVALRSPRPPGPLAVLETGPEGTGVTVFSDVATVTVLAGQFDSGADPSAPARLLTDAAARLGRCVPELTGGVVLAGAGGGVSDRALVVELTRLSGERPVVVLDRESVELLGALRPRRSPRPELPSPSPGRAGVTGHRLAATGLLGEPTTTGDRVRAALCCVVAALAAALLASVGTQPGRAHPGFGATGATGVSERAPAGRWVAAYDYTLALPMGWRHTGGLAQRQRTLLTPAATPRGSDLISVEETLLGYDGTVEPDRALGELRARFEQARSAGAELERFTLSVRFGDREVVGYRQRQPVRGAEVDWYVWFERDAQLSVGCQHTSAGARTVRAACAEVVRSLRMAS